MVARLGFGSRTSQQTYVRLQPSLCSCLDQILQCALHRITRCSCSAAHGLRSRYRSLFPFSTTFSPLLWNTLQRLALVSSSRASDFPVDSDYSSHVLPIPHCLGQKATQSVCIGYPLHLHAHRVHKSSHLAARELPLHSPRSQVESLGCT